MAVDMSNVKQIMHNNKEVIKIEDHLGNIIWGSQSEYPYRKLEYIKFNGAERIDTLETPKVGYYFLDCKTQNNSSNTNQWGFTWGAGHTVSGTYYRIWYENYNNIIRRNLKADKTNALTSASSYANTLLQYRCRIYATNNSSGTFWFAIHNITGVDVTGTPESTIGTEIWSQYTNNSSYGVNLNNFSSTLGIGCQHQNGSWNTTSYAKMQVYRYYVRQSTGSSAFKHLMFPCQRKSDNKCGLYDTVTHTFYPMVGTNTTTTAAGPVLDEYWDLTAPA